jgi:hypothetical protein
MLSHSIDKTQRGDESNVCGRLSNYESGHGSRIPRNARFRRQPEEPLNSQEEIPNSPEEVPDTIAEETTQNITDTTVQSAGEEESGNTSKQATQHNLNQGEEPPEDGNALKKEVEVEVINRTATYVFFFLF